MKKLIALILCMALCLCFTACGETAESNPSTPSSSGNTEIKELVLSDVYSTITTGVDMPEMFSLDADMMLDYCGINPDHCKQAIVYMCVNSLRADEIWLIEATDSQALELLKEAAQARLNQKDSESITYDPEQNAIVKKAQVITAGNYLAVIVSPQVDALASAFRTAAGIN